jgi:hypothetical protein
MWMVKVFCSDCAGEADVVVEDLEDVDREACPCGYGFVVLSIASLDPCVRDGGGG